MTPFWAHHGHDLPTIFRRETFPSKVEEVRRMTAERDDNLAQSNANLTTSQQRMRKSANKHRRPVEFSVGDWVYLKIQPYRLKSLARKCNEKLSPCFYGPYKVLEKIGVVACQLELPATSCIHPVFHVSLLKPALLPATAPQPLHPCFLMILSCWLSHWIFWSCTTLLMVMRKCM